MHKMDQTACGGKDLPTARTTASVLGWIILFKSLYLAVVYVCLLMWGDMDVGKFHQVNQRWPRVGEPVFATHFATWDAAHYLYLSEVGYKPGAPSDAFYPLWPLLMRWTAPLFGGSHLVAGMVAANVLSTAAFLLFYRITSRRFGPTVAGWSLVFLLIFPGSLFYQFIYTESLFLLLLMILWHGLEEKNYVTAWVAAFLLPLSRAVGVFCLLPVVWHLVSKNVSAGASPYRGNCGRARLLPSRGVKTIPFFKQALRAFILLAAPLLGWSVYFVLMWTWTGDAFWGFKAQKFWGVHSVWNLIDVPKFVVALANPSVLHDFTGSLVDRCVFVLVVFTLPGIWRLGKDLFLWVYVLGILTAMSGEFTSYTRFASTAFPVYIACGVFFSEKRPAWARVGFLGGCGAAHLVLLWQFVNFRWAG